VLIVNHPVVATHVGRPVARTYADGKRVMLLCPRGHVVETVAAVDFPGSLAEQRLSDPDHTVECRGASS